MSRVAASRGERKGVKSMRFRKKLNVTAEEFFNVLEASLRNDIEKYGMKKNGTYALEKGFIYKKILKKGDRKYPVQILLEQFERPSVYQVAVKAEGKIYQISYNIQKSEQGIAVIYEEQTRSADGTVNTTFSDNLLGRLKLYGEKRKMSMIETSILKNRKLEKRTGKHKSF